MIRATLISSLAATLFAAASCHASNPFFNEDFEANAAGWTDSARGELTHETSGGTSDSGFVTTDFAFATAGDFGAVLFRGEALPTNPTSPASGGAYTGNWITEEIENVSLSVQHDAPIPLNFGIRFGSPFNFPGSSAVIFQPVLPGGFAELSVDIVEGNPQFVTFEGFSFATVFSNVGNLQVTADIPSSFAVVDQLLLNVAANDAAITLPPGALLGDVYGAFSVVNTLLVDANGDPILDEGNQQFVDVQVPVGAPIFNTSRSITFGLDAIAITTAIPEPATAATAAAAVLVACVFRRRS